LEGSCTLRHDQIDRDAHQLRGKLGHAFDRVVTIAVLDHQITAFDVTEIGQTAAESVKIGSQARRPLRGAPADAVDPRFTLGSYRSPEARGGEDRRQERAALHCCQPGPAHSTTLWARTRIASGKVRSSFFCCL